MAEPKLKNCPFCGAKARIVFEWVKCSNNDCGAMSLARNTSAESALRWNRRVTKRVKLKKNVR